MRRFQEPAPAKAGGEFKLGNGRYCFPLTVTDHASRYLLLCEALESTRKNLAITAFEQLFQERACPRRSGPTMIGYIAWLVENDKRNGVTGRPYSDDKSFLLHCAKSQTWDKHR